MAPTDDTRTPTHFIALIDVSDSMSDANKLTNVKHCMSLLLSFLSPEDRFSLITFGESSKTHINYIQVDSAHIEGIKEKINVLKTHGCTNLSAGIASVCELMAAIGPAAATKTGLLILTDGHANRGVYDTETLRALVSRLSSLYPSISQSFIAYGSNHNANLLRACAEDIRGSYSIVDSVETAAVAMGEALGALISCVAQNVTIEVPAGSVVHGPYTITATNTICLGDLYSGSETVLLIDMQPATIPALTIRGVQLPLLATFTMDITAGPQQLERDVTIELTRLRYRCSAIFRSIGIWMQASVSAKAQIEAEIAQFTTDIADVAYGGHPIAEMLRDELNSINIALNMIQSNAHVNSAYLSSQLSQHAAYTALGRGATTHISAPSNVRYDSDDENPVPHVRSTSYLSPTASRGSRQVSEQMRQMSQGRE